MSVDMAIFVLVVLNEPVNGMDGMGLFQHVNVSKIYKTSRSVYVNIENTGQRTTEHCYRTL